MCVVIKQAFQLQWTLWWSHDS